MSAFSKILNSMSKSEHMALLKKLFYIAMNRTQRDEDEAKDLVSQTLERGLIKQEQFSGDNIDKWLVKLLKNIHLDNLKKGMVLARSKEEQKIIKNKLEVIKTELNLALDDNDLNQIKKLKEDKKELELKVKQKIKVVQRETEKTPELELHGNQILALVERDSSRCLGRLTELENDIIALRQQDYDYNQISIDLEITSANARVMFLRAKEKYIECMERAA
jgi:DNA-directed RNA polymerase specialized sigma24 family protein